MPFRESSPPTCPACRVDLVSATVGGFAVHECPQCRGHWVLNATFDRVVEMAFGRRIELLELDEGRARVCPVCRGPLADVFLHVMRLERCVDGTWCDPGELERVVRGDTGGAEIAQLSPKFTEGQESSAGVMPPIFYESGSSQGGSGDT